MTENEINNWQIRINVFGNTNHTIEIVEAIEKLKLGYDIRLLNIDKDEGEIDDETQNKCHSCGRIDSSLHQYVCDACLTLEKKQRQKDEEIKFPDCQYLQTWGDMAICTDCYHPAAYKRTQNGGYWHCPNPECPNIDTEHDQNCCGIKAFNAIPKTREELTELKKEHPHAEWI